MNTRARLERLTADLIAPAPAARPDPAPGEGSEPAPAVVAEEGSAGSPLLEHQAAPEPSNDLSGATDRPPEIAPRGSARRTGPGQMLGMSRLMADTEQEVTRLKALLEQHEGAMPARLIDPKLIAPSRYANRHVQSFSSPDFLRFKSDIEHAQGNVQPILVREVAGGAAPFEIVFGHRRHRACLELGIPVRAVVWQGPLSDLELFTLMDRENRERADLTPWEQGAMYQRALELGLFPSQRRLAEAVGVTHTWVRKTLIVATLPGALVECFRSPLEVQVRHAEVLADALEKDRRNVLRRAEKLRQSERMSASTVVAHLIGKHRGADRATREIRVSGSLAGRFGWDERGQATIRLVPGLVHEGNVDAVLAALQRALKGSGEEPSDPGA